MKEIKLTKQENTLITITSIVLFLFFFKTVHMKNASANHDLEAAIQAETASLAKAQNTYAEIQARAPASAIPGDGAHADQVVEHSIAQYVNANSNFSTVIATIAHGGDLDQSSKSPLTVNRIVNEKQEFLDGYSRTLFTLDVEASFPEIGSFLEKIEGSSLLTDVQYIEINRITDELKKCDAKIKLYSYVLR